MTTALNLVIRQGETFQRVIRWEAPPYTYKAITGITKAGPAAVTAVSHGLKTRWRAAIVSVLGMVTINAKHSPPRDAELKQITVVDADHVTFNEINSSDYPAYTSGGYLQFFTPVDLTGYSAAMTIKDRVGGTILTTLTIANARITLNASTNTINLYIAAADTAALTWKKGVYDLELTGPTGIVTTIYRGSISVTLEVTT